MSSHLECVVLTRIQGLGLPEPEQEFQFCPDRKFRFDFAWPEKKIAVEVDGGGRSRPVYCHVCGSRVMGKKKGGGLYPINLGGRHNSSGYGRDRMKMNLAAAMGWKVFGFDTAQIMQTGYCTDTLEDVIKPLLVDDGKERTALA